jgi:acetoin utilization deacetylase AcuC-like enzyme
VSVLYLTHRDCALHEMGEDHPECPDRLRAVWQALDRQEFTALIRGEAEEATMEQLAASIPRPICAPCSRCGRSLGSTWRWMPTR